MTLFEVPVVTPQTATLGPFEQAELTVASLGQARAVAKVPNSTSWPSNISNRPAARSSMSGSAWAPKPTT